MKLLRKTQSGDTIIEVLISMAILALVIGGTYASSTRSLSNGTDASSRQQAIALAQQQVELIKSDTSVASFKPPRGNFCIDNTDTLQSGSRCVLSKQYTITDTYDSSSGLYTILANWPSINSAGSQLTVYYRVPLPGAAPTPSINFSAAPNPVAAPGDATTLTWATAYLTRCTGTWPGGLSIGTSGSQAGVIPSAPSTTYTINCTGSYGPKSSSVVVSVTPGQPTLALDLCATAGGGTCVPSSHSPATISSGGKATLDWKVSNSQPGSCSLSSGGPSGFGDGSSSYTSGALSSNTTYTLSCKDLSGASSNQSVVVTVNPGAAPTVVTANPVPFVGTSTGNPDTRFGGTVNPNGLATTAYYQWSTSSSLPVPPGIPPAVGPGCTLATARFVVGSGTSPVANQKAGIWVGDGTTPVNFFNCGTNTYHYRLCAYNSAGSACGAMVTFTLGAGSGSSSSSSSSGSGSGGGGPPTNCNASWHDNSGGTADIWGNCLNEDVSRRTYTASFEYFDRLGNDCGGQSFGAQSSSTFSYVVGFEVRASGYLTGYNASGSAQSNTATGDFFHYSGAIC